MAEEPLEKVGSILAIVLAAILILNEIIAWSRCKANTLFQYLYSKLVCTIPEDENHIATQAPQSL
jgi:hypothetical protein